MRKVISQDSKVAFKYKVRSGLVQGQVLSALVRITNETKRGFPWHEDGIRLALQLLVAIFMNLLSSWVQVPIFPQNSEPFHVQA